MREERETGFDRCGRQRRDTIRLDRERAIPEQLSVGIDEKEAALWISQLSVSHYQYGTEAIPYQTSTGENRCVYARTPGKSIAALPEKSRMMGSYHARFLAGGLGDAVYGGWSRWRAAQGAVSDGGSTRRAAENTPSTNQPAARNPPSAKQSPGHAIPGPALTEATAPPAPTTALPTPSAPQNDWPDDSQPVPRFRSHGNTLVWT